MKREIFDLHGRRLPVITLDFETYYETGKKDKYSLSGMSTTEYIRDSRFKAHGAAIQYPGKQAIWVSHADLPNVLQNIDWKQFALLCHNTAFDGFILHHHYGCSPAYLLDTLSMSRGEYGVHRPHSLDNLAERLKLGSKLKGVLEGSANVRDLPSDIEQKLAEYAKQDVELTSKCFDALYYDRGYPEQELHIIDLTLKAYVFPKIVLDQALVNEELEEEIQTKSSYIERAGVPASVLQSNPQFADLLRQRGVEPPMKISPTTGKPTYAFAKMDLAFQELENDPRVSDIMLARKAVKSTIGETRALRLKSHANPAVPIMLNYCQAHTHRWTGGDKMNPQNFKRGGRLRRALKAPKGYVIGVVDSSQIECRTNAAFCGQEDLLDDFRAKIDVYSSLASSIYGRPIRKRTDPHERQVGKVAELGLGYGMSYNKFQYTIKSGQMGPPMDISDRLAWQAVQVYRGKRNKIVAMWNLLQIALGRMILGETFEIGPVKFYPDRIIMPNELPIWYPNLTGEYDPHTEDFKNITYASRHGTVYLYGAKFLENIIQSLARTIVAEQALEIARRFKILLLVHDEVVFLMKESEAEEGIKYAINCFSQPPSYFPNLPVTGEGGYDYNYSK